MQTVALDIVEWIVEPIWTYDQVFKEEKENDEESGIDGTGFAVCVSNFSFFSGAAGTSNNRSVMDDSKNSY